jgi:hypothetical protein
MVSKPQKRQKLQFRIPGHPIRTLQRPLPPIPENRAHLEPLLTTTNRMHGALVAKIHILANRETLGVFIGEDDFAGCFGLADGICGAWIVEEDVVDAARVPGVDAFGATEGGVTDEGVAAAVVVAGVVVGAVVVFLGVY